MREAEVRPERPNVTAGETLVAPREVESRLVEIWQRVLDVPEVGLNDNFFDIVMERFSDYRLIDHVSLRALTMFGEVASAFGRDLPVATLLEAPTVSALSEVLLQESPTLPWGSLVAIRTTG